jgi:hypothetical protein
MLTAGDTIKSTITTARQGETVRDAVISEHAEFQGKFRFPRQPELS